MQGVDERKTQTGSDWLHDLNDKNSVNNTKPIVNDGCLTFKWFFFTFTWNIN